MSCAFLCETGLAPLGSIAIDVLVQAYFIPEENDEDTPRIYGSRVGI
tara:strand:+ start:971 stop:1111 length:141 start_codon:yes stop_codon:yes gene_type:complete